MEREGVIKYTLGHVEGPLELGPHRDTARALLAWRSLLADVGGIGIDPARYGGVGFGNASARLPPFPGARRRRAFLVTASQTGALRALTERELALVTGWDFARFALESRGRAPPSSEALTHAAIYDASPAMRAVLHVHEPTIYRHARALRIAATDARAAYGTAEMVDEIARVWRETASEERGLVVMGGHEDGVIAFGRSLDEAGARLVTALAHARALT